MRKAPNEVELQTILVGEQSPAASSTGSADDHASLTRKSPPSVADHVKIAGVSGYTFVLGLAFFLNFSAFSPTQNFLTINFGATGTIALGVLYAVFALTTLISPFLIEKAGDPRNSLMLACLGYIAFVGSTLIGQSAAIYVGSVLCGIGAGVLWPVSGVIVTRLSTDATRGRTAGVFYTLARMSNMAGNTVAGVWVAAGATDTFITSMFLIVNTLGLVMFVVFRYSFQLPETGPTGSKNQPDTGQQQPGMFEMLLTKLRMVFKFKHKAVFLPM
jgi:MFS family permease